jgi:4-diphosphocytidyl-2-C-methyl-D-erythritol kinase
MKKAISCPAKLNLTLEVVQKMKNGFHELRTVMVKLPNLKDQLEIDIIPGKNNIEIVCDDLNIPTDDRNICYKAARSFLEKVGQKNLKVKIKIKKQIPVGAGLGGGSSDAAGVFKVLNQYFKYIFSKKELIEMAAEIGKDIPFFFSKKDGALIGGAGEKILEEFDFRKGHFLIVNPNIHISTPEAFSDLKKSQWFLGNIKRENVSNNFLKSLKKEECFEKYFYNDFEISIERKYSIIKEIKQSLLTFGADGVLMSGSGSTVFGYFKNKRKISLVKEKLQRNYGNFLIEIG